MVHKTSGCEQYRQLVSKYKWDVDIALAIMRAESGCDPTVDNTGLNEDGTNDVGLMQVNSIHLNDKATRKDPAVNIRLAYSIYSNRATWDTSGWKAWSAYNNGKYLAYL